MDFNVFSASKKEGYLSCSEHACSVAQLGKSVVCSVVCIPCHVYDSSALCELLTPHRYKEALVKRNICLHLHYKRQETLSSDCVRVDLVSRPLMASQLANVTINLN